ncbi:tyrosine recombinase XerC [Rhodococcus sp. NPDC127530]|uniref:site-specific integrase n=1 Tax=unclassified Rhodococcus (in: high G+C Gram-positive bacteria) TaxID=192944 RepID=UPI003633282F
MRSLQRDTPAEEKDPRGAIAEKALTDALAEVLGFDGHGSKVSPKTELKTLAELYVDDPKRADHALRTRDTYARVIRLLLPRLGSIRVGEATPRRLGRILDDLASDHGQTTAKQAKTILTSMFAIAVREGAVPRNPVRDVEQIKVKPTTAKGATRALTGPELAQLLHDLKHSSAPLPPLKGAKKDTTTRTVAQWARDVDLVDPIIMLAGTGLRRSELLGLRWDDYDPEAGTITVAGHVVRGSGAGLIREDITKTRSSGRAIVLPGFAVDMLERRRGEIHPVDADIDNVIFPSVAGTYRDPDNFAGQWRRVRGVLGFGWLGTHGFRKTVATLLDDAGLSARVGADVLGHANTSMTQDKYHARKRVHKLAAQALDDAIAPIKGE